MSASTPKVKAPKAAKTPKAKAEVKTVKTVKTPAAPKAEVKTPKAKAEVKVAKAIEKRNLVGNKAGRVGSPIFKEEINYIVARIKRTERKEVGHYSYLLASTLKALTDMGITYHACGKHGYIFDVPKKNTKAWKNIENYKM